MTDFEALEYIKKHLVDIDKAFGTGRTLIGAWCDYSKEFEEWLESVLANRPTNKPKVEQPTLWETSSEEHPIEDDWKNFLND